MRRRRFTEEQIIGILKESLAGSPTKELCRTHGISTATFYSWRKKYGDMDVPDARRLRLLEDENRKLKQLVADLTLDKQALKTMLSKKF